MNTRSARRKSAPAPFQVVSLTQHWRRIDGRWYRDAVVVVDGERRLYALPEVAA